MVVIISHNHELSLQSCTTANKFVDSAGLEKRGINKARRLLPEHKARGQTLQACDLAYSGGSLSYLGAECPQIVCGPPIQILKVVKAHKDTIRYVVFDEADAIIQEDKQKGKGGGRDSGPSNEDACRDIVQAAMKKKGQKPQVGLFSATYSAQALGVATKLTAKGGNGQVHRLKMEGEEMSVDSIVQCVLIIPGRDQRSQLENKMKLLHELVGEVKLGQIVIFVNRIDCIDTVIEFFEEQGMAVDACHGKISEEERRTVLKNFESNALRVLLITDQLARGWDPKGVGLVVQFDMPHPKSKPVETYQHRIGRTGRAGRNGVAMSFVTPMSSMGHDEEQLLAEIKQTYGKSILELTEDNYIDRIKRN